MQKITRIALGLGAAAVVASGGSAFTAGLAVQNASNEHLGYASYAVSGVAVDNVTYNRDATSPDTITTIVFALAANPTVTEADNKAELRINNLTNSSAGLKTCIIRPSGAANITCTIGESSNSFSSISLSVTPRTNES